jgi:hypothetical protein
MSTDHRRRDYAIDSPRRWFGFSTPRFYLRFRLRLVRHAIANLEQQLADEFATLETTHLIRELDALTQERDALLRRLAEVA